MKKQQKILFRIIYESPWWVLQVLNPGKHTTWQTVREQEPTEAYTTSGKKTFIHLVKQFATYKEAKTYAEESISGADVVEERHEIKPRTIFEWINIHVFRGLGHATEQGQGYGST